MHSECYYRSEEEIGSALSIVIDGNTVLDIWGGWKDGARLHEWQHNTIVCMMSVSKGITGLAFNLLVDRGLVAAHGSIMPRHGALKDIHR